MPKFRINAIKYTSYSFDIEAADEHEANQYSDDLTEEYCIERCGEGNVHFEAEEAEELADKNIHS